MPKTNQTGANEWADVEDNDNAIKKVVNGELTNANLSGSAGITRANLASEARGIAGKWYTPKIIATEESRTNTAFGTLTTADEIKEVVLPENGQIEVGYQARWKESVNGAGRAAIFIGSNQLKVQSIGTEAGKPSPQVQQALMANSEAGLWVPLLSGPIGLLSLSGTATGEADVSTGQALAAVDPAGGYLSFGVGTAGLHVGTGAAIAGGGCKIFASAGTYNISVQFKASSGSVTAKERKLWVEVHGY